MSEKTTESEKVTESASGQPRFLPSPEPLAASYASIVSVIVSSQDVSLSFGRPRVVVSGETHSDSRIALAMEWTHSVTLPISTAKQMVALLQNGLDRQADGLETTDE